MADISRAEVARLEKKAESYERNRARERAITKGWGNLALLEGTSFLTGYARGRLGDGDRLTVGPLPIPLDLVAAAGGLAFGLKKGKGAAAATAVGAGALASFLSHEGNKIGQRAKQRGNLIGAAYPHGLIGAQAPHGIVGNQYNIVGADAGMGAGGAANYARNAW